MLLTTKGRYAVMAMVDIAMNEGEKPVRLACVAERQGIDQGYLEQLFVKLKKTELVKPIRGPGGGYKLTKPSAEIVVSEIMCAVEENIEMVRCNHGSEKGCLGSGAKCATHELWQELGDRINGFLESVSLADICAKRINGGSDA